MGGITAAAKRAGVPEKTASGRALSGRELFYLSFAKAKNPEAYSRMTKNMGLGSSQSGAGAPAPPPSKEALLTKQTGESTEYRKRSLAYGRKSTLG